MKILICPDKFKGSLTAKEAAECIKRGITRTDTNADCLVLPLADGGEGTVEALINATGGTIESVSVHDPLMRPINSFIGISSDRRTAFIEMSAASGLQWIKPEERNPMIATSYGTGELIMEALEYGCEKIIIGLGGSATVDGGVGMAQALGIRFLDAEGNILDKGGSELKGISKIDTSNRHPGINNCHIVAASDVTNVFAGPDGAAIVFGPQKGAGPEQVKTLDESLTHLAILINRQLKVDIGNLKGSGAAGGMGGGIIAFLGGEICKGFELISAAINLEQHIKDSDLVITGEGKIDQQTAYGKTPAGVAELAAKYGKPVIAFAGTLGENIEQIYRIGFDAVITIPDRPMNLEESMRNAGNLLEKAAESTFRLILIGERRIQKQKPATQ